MLVMLKYDFSIRTREGQKLESIVIAGRDQADAERKLLQMYRQCTILRCDINNRSGTKAAHKHSVEELLSLITK